MTKKKLQVGVLHDLNWHVIIAFKKWTQRNEPISVLSAFVCLDFHLTMLLSKVSYGCRVQQRKSCKFTGCRLCSPTLYMIIFFFQEASQLLEIISNMQPPFIIDGRTVTASYAKHDNPPKQTRYSKIVRAVFNCKNNLPCRKVCVWLGESTWVCLHFVSLVLWV